ncbi:4'-phosphopantetheinyl transferase superfamily protein [Actinoplanes sp. NPDC048791]|uniref:4'-phosphopantetheinyl transferase family protein n=1 Tax=Actinoplanes sp. NPDC048791 TaxID=3154623 RepID=UPI0033D5150F
MLDRILPPTVRTAHTRSDPPASLFPAEAALVANAVAKRKQEFTTVRTCARLALAELGVPPAPILPGVRGAPVWPDGIVGSMTHCAGYRAAAVARTSEAGGIGIDAEEHGPLPDGVLELVASPDERAHLAGLASARPEVCWERLLFSAKESVYKVWSPRTGEWLGFEEAAVSFDPEAATFTARVLVPGPFSVLTGRYLVEDGLVLTAIALPPLSSLT